MSIYICILNNVYGRVDIASIAVRGLNTDVIMKSTYTQIVAKLHELAVLDLNPATKHNMVSF